MPAQLPTHHAQGQSPSPPPWKDPCPQRPTPLVRDLSIAHACCWIPPPTPKTCSGPRWFSGEAGRAGSPRRLSPPVCGCLRPGSQRGRARVRKVSVEGPGRGQGREAASALSGAFPTPPCCGHKGVGRGGPVATVGLQGQRVDPRRRWHNWKNRGGNLAGGCVRDGAHCGRSTAGRSGGGWCGRRSRGPSPARTARPAAAERGASPGAPGSAPEQRGGVGAEPPPPRLPAPAQGRASPAGLTRFFISKAWMAGS